MAWIVFKMGRGFLTKAEGLALSMLVIRGDWVSFQDIRTALGWSQSWLSHVVRGLTNKGLVKVEKIQNGSKNGFSRAKTTCSFSQVVSGEDLSGFLKTTCRKSKLVDETTLTKSKLVDETTLTKSKLVDETTLTKSKLVSGVENTEPDETTLTKSKLVPSGGQAPENPESNNVSEPIRNNLEQNKALLLNNNNITPKRKEKREIKERKEKNEIAGKDLQFVVFSFAKILGIDKPDRVWIAREMKFAKRLMREFKMTPTQILNIVSWRLEDPYWFKHFTSLGLIVSHYTDWKREAMAQKMMTFQEWLNTHPTMDYRQVPYEQLNARLKLFFAAFNKALKEGVIFTKKDWETYQKAWNVMERKVMKRGH